MSFQTKIGRVKLLENKRYSKVLVRAELKPDVLQIFKQNVLKTLRLKIEQERSGVVLHKGEDGFGMHIKGGKDYNKPVTIHKLLKGYPAIESGQIFEDDLVLSINGEPVQNKNHDEVVDMLINSGKCATLHLAQIKAAEEDEGEPDYKKERRGVVLHRGEDGFGMYIMGGKDYNKPVTIRKLLKGHPAIESGQIFEGDLVLSINGEPVQNKKHNEVIDMLKNSGKHVTLHLAQIKAAEEDEDEPDYKKQDNKSDWIIDKEIPLTTALITKYEEGIDELRSNAFQVVSMDGQNSVVLFFGDSNENMQDWYESIHNNISILNQEEVKKQNSEMIEGEEKIHHMGYVHEQIAANPNWSNWQIKFLVLRKAHIEIFAAVPQTVSEWMRPEKAYGLTEISIELLPAKPGRRPECIKLIAGIGDSHIISFEHHDDIVAWTNNIQVATSLVVKQMKTARFPASWQNQEVDFIINYNHGLSIETHDGNKKVWSRSFSKLRGSSDDGNRKLTMEFTDSSKEVIELEDLNIALCTLQAFLATRVADIDMAFIVQTGVISPA